ncbi:MAG: sugar ABC transporter substrate-binding protein [Patescibacteria group bacterium]|nr:sugar ABC transporter substrate-binding protein [Patescibacteria group bacterium]
MDDNNQNSQQNQQEKPIFETVSVDQESNANIGIEEAPEEYVDPKQTNNYSYNNLPPIFQENKNQYFLIIFIGVILFFLFLFLIKSLFGKNKSLKPVNLIYWGLWEDKQIIQPLIDEYQQKNSNVKIEYIKMSPENYRDKLIARSKLNQGPDIFRFHNTWVPELKEVLAPLPKQIMSNSDFEKIFYKIHQKDLKVGNYYYGIPLMIDGLVLVCNQDLFKKAGIDFYPSTWDDVSNIVPKLTVKDINGNIITSGIAIGTTNNLEHFSDIFGLFLIQNGLDNLNQLKSKEASEALKTFRRFSEPPNNFWSEEMPNSINAFVQEKVAMIIVPSWQILTIKSINPELKIKVINVPIIPGSDLVSLANYWVEGVSRYSKNQIEAWKFIKFLSEKENLTKLYEIASRFRLFGFAYSRVDLKNILIQNEYLGSVLKQSDNYISLPLISRTFDNGLNDEIIRYIENAINSTIQGVSYDEALKTADQGIKQVFTKYNINY